MKRLTSPCHPADNPTPVLNTPPLAVPAPVSHSGIFTSIGFGFPVAGSAQSYNSLQAKAASGLMAVLKYPLPLNRAALSTKPLGGHHHG